MLRPTHIAAALTTAALLSACGGSATSSGARTDASPCAATVVDALAHVAHNVYNEGTAKMARGDLRTVQRSRALASAVRAGDRGAILAAARAQLRAGHVVDLEVREGPRVLARAGSIPALAPLSGPLAGTRATVVISALSETGFVSAARALTGGGVSVRRSDGSVVGSLASVHRPLPARGLFRHGGRVYRVASFSAGAFPSGHVRIALARSLQSTRGECGATPQATVRHTIGHSLHQIYRNEHDGGAMQTQLRAVAHDAVLARAVRDDSRGAARAEITRMLGAHTHIVRIRVRDAAGRVVADVGGPYVIAPRSTALLLGGRRVGTATISIQDDLGYVLLARRLLGVEMALTLPPGTRVTPAQAQVVASSSVDVAGIPVRLDAGPPPRMTTLAASAGMPPHSGDVRYRGRDYDAYSFSAAAFPSGSLLVTALIPVPYR